MGLLSLTLPSVGQPNATEQPKVRDALSAIQSEFNGNIDTSNIAAGTILKSGAIVTSLPANPVDGQECFYLADSTNGVVWHLKYRAGSASAFKWEYVGGASLYSEITTSEATSSTAYSALTTAGPLLTVPLAGDYMVTHGATVTPGASAGDASFMSYDIGATAAVDADAAIANSTFSSGDRIQASVSRERRKTFATSTVLTAKYRNSAVAVGTWANRWMRLTPVRVG